MQSVRHLYVRVVLFSSQKIAKHRSMHDLDFQYPDYDNAANQSNSGIFSVYVSHSI